jgi:hypothetical protein
MANCIDSELCIGKQPWLLYVKACPKQFDLFHAPVSQRRCEPELKEFLAVCVREGGLLPVGLAATLTGVSRQYLYRLRRVKLRTFNFYGYEFLSVAQLREWRTGTEEASEKNPPGQVSRRVWVQPKRARKVKTKCKS